MYVSWKHRRENARTAAVEFLKSINHETHQMDSNSSLCYARMYT